LQTVPLNFRFHTDIATCFLPSSHHPLPNNLPFAHLYCLIHLWLDANVSCDLWVADEVYVDPIHSDIALASASFTPPFFYLSHKITMCWVMEWSMTLGFSIAQTTILCTFTCTQPIKIKVKFSCARNNGTYREEDLYCTYF